MDAHQHRTRTLWFAAILHGFTHVYQVALLPLYLPIQNGFGLHSIEQSTLLVTVMMLAYFAPSYPMGMLADRFSRKQLLGWGLLINALGFVGLALAPNYPAALACVVVTGIGGSFYHPAATALVARLYPVGTGKALGMVGIGASVGFFIGPIYAGWRAEESGNWRSPVLELGLLGVVAAGLFAWLADDDASTTAEHSRAAARKSGRIFPNSTLWLWFLAAAFCFGLRDFAGSSMGSLGSLYLQKAHGFSLTAAGTALGGIFIASAISNPLFGHLSDRGRKRWTAAVLAISVLLVAGFPHVPTAWIIPAYLTYGFFFMANYPMVEAALMEAVPDHVRGRVFGLFITVGGLIGNLSHWLVGGWVNDLGPRNTTPEGYYSIYNGLAGLMLVSMTGLLCLHAIRRREEEVLHQPLKQGSETGVQLLPEP